MRVDQISYDYQATVNERNIGRKKRFKEDESEDTERLNLLRRRPRIQVPTISESVYHLYAYNVDIGPSHLPGLWYSNGFSDGVQKDVVVVTSSLP
jgi:hypothetical protein